jgi:hypothetical protein
VSWQEHVIAPPERRARDDVPRTVSQRPLWRGDGTARVFIAVGALEEGAGIPLADSQRSHVANETCSSSNRFACSVAFARQSETTHRPPFGVERHTRIVIQSVLIMRRPPDA